MSELQFLYLTSSKMIATKGFVSLQSENRYKILIKIVCLHFFYLLLIHPSLFIRESIISDTSPNFVVLGTFCKSQVHCVTTIFSLLIIGLSYSAPPLFFLFNIAENSICFYIDFFSCLPFFLPIGII